MRAQLPQSSLTLRPYALEARQAPLSMGFFRQEYWSGLLCPPLGDLPNPGMNLHLLQLLHCRWILYHGVTAEAPSYTLPGNKSVFLICAHFSIDMRLKVVWVQTSLHKSIYPYYN